MSCCKELSSQKTVKLNNQAPFSQYKKNFNQVAYSLMQQYELISLIEGDDIPDIFYDKKTKTCCVLFHGDEQDIEVLEEYLKTRP